MVKAVLNMPIPVNKSELQRFLGMINYLAKFVPDLSTITAPLRMLLQKDINFIMETQQVEAILKLKQLITTPPILQFYNPSARLRVRTDASGEGLGAVLEQMSETDWHPVAYASRSTTKAEKN